MNIIIIDPDDTFCKSTSQYLKSHSGINTLKTFPSVSHAMPFLDSNQPLLDLIIFNFAVLDVNIRELNSHIPKDCGLLAITEEDTDIQAYINYPYVQRVFQKPISCSDLMLYLSIQNHIETFDNTKKFIVDMLSKIGFSQNHVGTDYIIQGTIIAKRNQLKKLSDIYNLVAYQYHTEPRLVGWSINNAINHALKSSSEKKIQDFFQIYDNRKLTAKYVINYFVHKKIEDYEFASAESSTSSIEKER